MEFQKIQCIKFKDKNKHLNLENSILNILWVKHRFANNFFEMPRQGLKIFTKEN